MSLDYKDHLNYSMTGPATRQLKGTMVCVDQVSPQHNPREHNHMTDSPIEEQASVGESVTVLCS